MRRVLWPALVILALEAACSSETNKVQSQTCSNGAPYAPGTDFERADEPAAMLECVRHCGPNLEGSRGQSIAALPSGACAYSEPACSMGAEQLPQCPAGQTPGGPTSNFACACEAGQWKCRIASQGASVFTCDGMPGGVLLDGGR